MEDKTEQILQETGKEPKPVKIIINLSKLWRWWKRRKNDKKNSN